MRGAWIEIWSLVEEATGAVSLPMRGAWIEIRKVGKQNEEALSLPMRGAWIEIHYTYLSPHRKGVAPHAGSVD